jgi:hypothetical protein
MTSNAAIIYLPHQMNKFKGKRIGLIWDKHTSHYSKEVLQSIKKCNEDESTTTTIVLEFVDEGFTPITQVPDVVVNKVLIRIEDKISPVPCRDTSHNWQKGCVSCEMLVDFVLDTIDDINNDNNEHQFISESFKRCRLNPWSKEKSMEAFGWAQKK